MIIYFYRYFSSGQGELSRVFNCKCNFIEFFFFISILLLTTTVVWHRIICWFFAICY